MAKTHIRTRQASDPFNQRLYWLTVFFFVIFGVIIVRLGWLQIVSAKQYRDLAEQQHLVEKNLNQIRGEIKINDQFSGSPHTVATSVELDTVAALPFKIKQPEKIAKQIAAIIEVPESELVAKLADQSKKYLILRKRLPEDRKKQLEALRIDGIVFEPEIVRLYPEKSFLSQVLGYVGFKDNEKVGQYGLEQFFEIELKGQSGSLAQEKDPGGTWIFGGRRDIKPALDGINLLLTIDKSIQFKTESILKDAVTKHGADSGSITVVDPKTGAVLAMATYPTFDPNNYSEATNLSVFNNQPATGNYEPGSIFKPLTIAASVNEGKISADTTYYDSGQINIDGYTIKNSDEKAHGTQTMSQVLEESLNTGVIFAKNQIGNTTFLKYVKDFGFGEPTGIELQETKGSLANLTGNITVNFHTASFGQGLTVTPLQMVQAFTAFANGGKMMKPYIIQAKIEPSGKTVTTQPQVVREVITPKTASAVSAMLVNVVEKGHGKKAAVPGYYIAGKTGTAQVPRKDGKGYEKNNNIGSFIGYGPVEDPRFVAIVRINHPRDVVFAESSAAPAFGELARFLMNYYNIPPNRPIANKP